LISDYCLDAREVYEFYTFISIDALAQRNSYSSILTSCREICKEPANTFPSQPTTAASSS